MDPSLNTTIRPIGLAGQTTRGLMWMMVSTFIAKVASFASQIVLGWVLLKEDFGIYAIAISIASLVQILKDGGTRKIIMQRGAKRFERLCPAVFWMSTGFNTLTALILAGLAYPAALLYHEPRLTVMLLILSLSSLIGTPDTMYRAWLSAQLRFREQARILTMQGLVRSSSMIALALLGADATSFVWPMVLVSIVGWAYGFKICGPLPIRGPIRFRIWPALFNASLWLFVGSSALLMLKQGPYMILGLNHDAAVVGVYFFAFQLLIQINQMVALNFQAVLLPTLSALQRNLKRHANAVLRTSEALIVASTLIALTMSVGIYDVVQLIWGEKWIEAVPAIYWMGLFFPFRMFQSVFEPALLSRGMYRPWAWLMCLQAVIVLTATLVATFFMDTPGEFALAIGIGFMVSMVAATWIGMRRLGVNLVELLRRTLPAYLLGASLYGAMLYLRYALGLNSPRPAFELIVQCVLLCGVYGAAYVVFLRIFIPRALHSVCEALPGKAGRLSRRMFFLPKP